MLDTALPYIPLTMERADLENLPVPVLPAGYGFRMYRPGDAGHWAEIQVSCGAFERAEQALECFERDFGGQTEQLQERMVFLLNPRGRPVGTAAAWFEGAQGRLHWVAIAQEEQGRGLCRPLVAQALARLRALNHAGVFLTTQPASWVAIKVYRRLGFVPSERAEELTGWALVDKRLEEAGACKG